LFRTANSAKQLFAMALRAVEMKEPIMREDRFFAGNNARGDNRVSRRSDECNPGTP
jgi:hypothetical protein